MMGKMTEAKRRGAEDHAAGRWPCPYNPLSKAALAWSDGWEQAHYALDRLDLQPRKA